MVIRTPWGRWHISFFPTPHLPPMLSEMLALDASEKDVLVGSVVGGISVEVAGDVVLAVV